MLSNGGPASSDSVAEPIGDVIFVVDVSGGARPLRDSVAESFCDFVVCVELAGLGDAVCADVAECWRDLVLLVSLLDPVANFVLPIQGDSSVRCLGRSSTRGARRLAGVIVACRHVGCRAGSGRPDNDSADDRGARARHETKSRCSSYSRGIVLHEGLNLEVQPLRSLWCRWW